MSDPVGATSVSFDDIQQELDAGKTAAADVTQVKLDGENVPDDLRGKSVKEVIEALRSREQALKLSEAARLESVERVTPAPAPVAASAPVEEPEVTDEQIAQLYDEQPLKAIEAMNARAIRRAEKNLEIRLGPLVNGTAAQVEQAARSKYADEFELFGAEISSVASQIPNARAVLSNPGAWDNIIAMVRGREGNFDKLIQHKAAKQGAPTRETVRAQQASTVGFSDHSGGRSPAAQPIGGLDPIQKEIASKMNMTEADYIKWSKIS